MKGYSTSMYCLFDYKQEVKKGLYYWCILIVCTESKEIVAVIFL